MDRITYILTLLFSRRRRPYRGIGVGLALLVPLSLPGDAGATAIFDAQAVVTLQTVSIVNLTAPGALADLLIDGDAFVSSESAEPGATANAAASFDPSGRLALSASAGGDSGLHPSVGALALTEGFLSFENASTTDTFELALELVFAVSASATADDPGLEIALADAFVELFASSSPIGESFFALADSGFDPAMSDSGAIPLSLFLAPGEMELLTLFADVTGLAEGSAAVVPAPATSWLLLAAGLHVFWLSRRRTH